MKRHNITKGTLVICAFLIHIYNYQLLWLTLFIRVPLSHPNPPTISNPNSQTPTSALKFLNPSVWRLMLSCRSLHAARPENVCPKKPVGLKKKMPICDFCLKKGCKYVHRFDGVKDMFIAEVKGVLEYQIAKVQLIMSREIEISSDVMWYESCIFGKITAVHLSI